MKKNDVRHFGKQNAHRCGPTIFRNAPRGLMLWKHASKYTKQMSGFCQFGVLHLMNIPTKCESKWSSQNTDIKADPHTSDTKKNLGFLRVWTNSPDEHSYEMWEQWSSQKTDLKADPPTFDIGASFCVYDLQSSVWVIFSSLFGPLSVSMTSKVVCKLISHPCLGLFQCLSPPK
jgi:hypothetical protein